MKNNKKIKEVMKKINKIISNLIILILSILAITIIYASIQLNILNKDYLNILGYSFFEVKTGSMKPTIDIEDIVIVKINENADIGDIITYKENNSFITHRLIGKENNKIIAKGDSNSAEDKPISQNQIVGKVVHTINNVQVWKKVIKDPKVIISVTITIILFVIMVSYKEKEEKENKEDTTNKEDK